MKKLKGMITFRCPLELKAAIESVAEGLERSMSWVICNKMKEIVPDETKQIIDPEIESNDADEKKQGKGDNE